MKQFTVKINDFKNNYITIKQANQIIDNLQEQIESFNLSIKFDFIKRVLVKNKKVLLITTVDGVYYITSRPCYVKSIFTILTQVGINDNQIKVLKKSNDSQACTIEDIKGLFELDTETETETKTNE